VSEKKKVFFFFGREVSKKKKKKTQNSLTLSSSSLLHLQPPQRQPGGAPRLSDLRRVAKLGSGAFGKVSLVTTAAAAATAAAATKAKSNNKENNNNASSSSSSLPFYALKTLSKAALVEAGLVEHVRRERATMAECDSAFVVRLVASFQEPSKLHLLQEAVPGGELFGLLADRADAGLGPLSEVEARFYAGCVVLG